MAEKFRKLAACIGHIQVVDPGFLKEPKHYVVQSLLAIVAVVIILNFVELLTHAAIVAALGSSTFLVFAMPRTPAAQPRRLIGGHIVGLLSGLASYYLFYVSPLGTVYRNIEILHWLPAAVSIGFSIFLMAIFNFEHPPAAGTALGIMAHEWTGYTFLFVLAFAVSLAVMKWLLKNYLRNLF